ncbi:16101_t:CDS:2, partial [Gigaspora margarita]
SSNTETDSRTSVRTSSSAKVGCPPSDVWKFFEKGASKSNSHWEGSCSFCERFYLCAKPYILRVHLANSCKKVPKEWCYHFNYIIVNNLENVPTDEPLYAIKNSQTTNITNWYNSMKIEPSKQLIIDEAIVLAFIMCNTEIAKIINKVDKILDHTNNLTIGIDAIKLFSITPSSASCKRMFSLLGWIYGNKRTQLDVDQLEELAKIYQFNLSNPAEQLHYIHTTEVSPKIMANIAKSVFKELEEKTLLDDDVELSNPSEDLYSDEPNLNLKILNIIDFQSLVFIYTHSRTSFKDLNRDESDNNDMQDNGESEYNVDEIVARQLDYDLNR